MSSNGAAEGSSIYLKKNPQKTETEGHEPGCDQVTWRVSVIVVLTARKDVPFTAWVSSDLGSEVTAGCPKVWGVHAGLQSAHVWTPPPPPPTTVLIIFTWKWEAQRREPCNQKQESFLSPWLPPELTPSPLRPDACGPPSMRGAYSAFFCWDGIHRSCSFPRDVFFHVFNMSSVCKVCVRRISVELDYRSGL